MCAGCASTMIGCRPGTTRRTTSPSVLACIKTESGSRESAGNIPTNGIAPRKTGGAMVVDKFLPASVILTCSTDAKAQSVKAVDYAYRSEPEPDMAKP